ncbi:epoxide hydrolase 1 [Pararhizobium sp. BT-229]|uniref:epoxide hydrolase family protein n=1 Tax=Pararhizobium sp. BT-229 TaxID=2986923 RepID=UPI0021F6F6FC|nr:epoxide hydrolase family protein [Pararhizobium sp. BT-229]MCV9961896.1 epoxide hydrolase 1 [Pararhizobium sp. BT-229]
MYKKIIAAAFAVLSSSAVFAHAEHLSARSPDNGTINTVPTSKTAAIRPFRVHVPDADLADLKRRLAATRWPDQETVTDASQGAQLAKLQELVRHWGTDYDWRKGEAKLNAHPQFKTVIDGIDIHFIHVRSRHPNAMPLIVTHGWPGSIFEQIKIIGPLIDPTAYGGRAEDAFDVVIPSLPGYGFSSRPTETGWGVERIGRAWDVLMKRLGYTRYVAQGGDWGAGVVEAMARQAPTGLLGIHTNLPAVFPPDAAEAIATGRSAPAGLTAKEHAEFDAMQGFIKNGGWGYLTMMSARPQAVGYGLTDSPAGLAGWMLVHGGFGKWTYGKDPEQRPTPDEVLDNFSLHWLTNTVSSGARLYWENRDQNLISAAAQKTDKITIPVAITTFPDDDLFRAPETWARRAFPSLTYFHDAERGGHFPAWEEPMIFTRELRAAFKPLREELN